MEVGIRELKAKLSAYVERASKGETIVVTDRGRPVATLGPPFSGFDMDLAAEEGWLTLPTRFGELGTAPRQRAERTIAEVFAEDRGE